MPRAWWFAFDGLLDDGYGASKPRKGNFGDSGPSSMNCSDASMPTRALARPTFVSYHRRRCDIFGLKFEAQNFTQLSHDTIVCALASVGGTQAILRC